MEHETSPDPLLTTGEAIRELADRGLRIHQRTLIRWARSGGVPAETLPSGRLRYRLSDVAAIATSQPTV
ncbi:hypothetical protein CcI49_17060 [Frankia sp. CcI49]|uniref:helix-turn-helix domain-containing protein n=1 Tax=Frankia sp. CcI49 TaxID=1745382 RepID=UPI0009783442|nr:helix-turn-helix domain-containing protein [Frankia sp. CcI49]ONH59651.1 hypothetical protein CcI49_17060 [Frankia sp. CcI49]